MEDIIELLGEEYTFFKMDDRGNFISSSFPIDNFFDGVAEYEKIKAAGIFYDAKINGKAEGLIDFKEGDSYTPYFIRLILKDDEIWGIAKRWKMETPSFSTDLMGNIIKTSNKWDSFLGKNLFDIIEGKEKLIRLIREGIKNGEAEEKAELNGEKVIIRVKVKDNIEFYIKKDFSYFITAIAESKNEKELVDNISSFLDYLSYESYEVKVGNNIISKGKNEYNEIVEFESGYVKIYGEQKPQLELLPIAVSLSLKNKSFLINEFPFCIVNRDGEIVEINKKFEELTGYGDEIIGKKLNDISSHKNSSDGIRKWNGKNKELWIKEKWVKYKDGYIIFLDDVSEEKEKLDENEFLNSILRHDIFNKNQIAMGYIGLLEKTNLNKKQKEYIKRIKRSVEESNDLIQSIRELNEIKKDRKLKKVRADRILKEICENFEEDAKNHGMKIECNIKNATIIADDLIGEVFSNIIKNSIEHSNGNKIVIYGRDEDGKYEVIIEDNGKGIPKEFLENVFKEGWKYESKGSGLGLYISKKLMEKYGGNIKIESQPNSGTKVILLFRKTGKEKDFLKIRL